VLREQEKMKGQRVARDGGKQKEEERKRKRE